MLFKCPLQPGVSVGRMHENRLRAGGISLLAVNPHVAESGKKAGRPGMTEETCGCFLFLRRQRPGYVRPVAFTLSSRRRTSSVWVVFRVTMTPRRRLRKGQRLSSASPRSERLAIPVRCLAKRTSAH